MSFSTANGHCQLDLVEIIESEGIELRRQGRELVGLCPFHADKHPSFAVNVEKQLYYCHACAEGGDAIRFVEKFHGVTFKEALKLLGLDGARPPKPPDRGIRDEAKRIAAWARYVSRALCDKLRGIGRKKFLCRQSCALCGTEHPFLIEELERLKREWAILCDLDDDLNDASTVLDLWRDRATIDAFIEAL